MGFSQNITSLKNIFIEKDEEIEKLKSELKKKNEEIKQLQDLLNIVPGEKPFQTLNDYILHVCKDGGQRTVRSIFDEIDKMNVKPWSNDAKTPCNTCNAACSRLFKEGKLLKTNDTPRKYFMLLN
tara:strand:- start:269 stop:643 length:375 start_codon:yes stop_codon:yes gene_type:complete